MLYIKSGIGGYEDFNVSPEEKKKITQYALDYVISLTVQWFEDNKKAESNNFSISGSKTLPELNASKLLFYPFYFATANGSSKALFDVLGEFKMIDYGPISKVLYDIVQNNEQNLLSFEVDFLELRINDDFTLGVIQEKIRKKTAKNTCGTEVNFEDIYISKDKEVNVNDKLPIWEAIDTSYTALCTQSDNRFLDYDLTRFQEIARKYYTVNKKMQDKPNYDIIEYDDIIGDRRFVPVL